MKHFTPLFCLATLLMACEKEAVDTFPQETTMRVNYYRQNCQAVGPTTCYLVQEGQQVGSTTWNLFYDEIRGFQYEAGFVYTLKVRIEKVANPPADASDRKYVLLEVLSKESAEQQ